MPCKMWGRDYPPVVSHVRSMWCFHFLFASSPIGIPKYAFRTEPIQKLRACGDGVDFRLLKGCSTIVTEITLGGQRFLPPLNCKTNAPVTDLLLSSTSDS